MVKYIKTEQGYMDSSIFAPAPFKPEGKSYLTFSSPNSFTLEVHNKTKNWNGILEYFSADKVWAVWDGTTILSAYNNDDEYVLYLRGTRNTVITGNGTNKNWIITGTDIKCIGNIENLLDYATVASGKHPTMASDCYCQMFKNCTSLTQAPELPATTLLNYCYSWMFEGCTSLTQAPTLPATTLAHYCYYSMFAGCTSLTQAPELPATTLSYSCYSNMFNNCTSLTQAPALPATTLADNCYHDMFGSCTSLTKAPALPATTLVSQCYRSMFQGCTSLKLSSTKTGEYTQEYRIPSSGTGTTGTYTLINMFTSTGGTFTGTPHIGTTYYLSTDNMIVRNTEVATLNGYVGSMIDVAAVPTTRKINGKALSTDITLSATDVNAIDKYNGMTPVECVYTQFGSQQTKIIYVEEGTLIPPSSSASDDIKNAWTRLLAIPLSGAAATAPNSSFKDLIRGIGLLADNGVFGDLLSQSGNKFICYTDIFKQDVCLYIYNSKTDDKTITVYFNFYKQDRYQQVIYCISNDTFDDYCSFETPVKQYSSNINATALTMPQTEMAAAPTKDMQIATKKYVDDSVSNPLILPSSTEGSTKRFKITVDDSGTLTATEVM